MTTIYYLLIKTHKITGLRYMCQTKQKDPDKYPGSGIDWKLHLKQHGRKIDTTILKASPCKNIINDLGRHLSTKWRITTSMDDFGNRIWANRIPETGAGGGVTSIIAKNRFITHPHLIGKFKRLMSRPTIANKRKIARAITVDKPEYKSKIKSIMIEAMNRLEVKLRNSIAQREAQNRPEVKLRNSIAQREAQNRPEVKLKKHFASLISQNKAEVKLKKSGQNHYRYNHKVLTFLHANGSIFSGTAYEFRQKFMLDKGWLSNILRGVRHSIKGWKLIEP